MSSDCFSGTCTFQSYVIVAFMIFCFRKMKDFREAYIIDLLTVAVADIGLFLFLRSVHGRLYCLGRLI